MVEVVTVLGLDLGRTTGWCVTFSTAPIEWGEWKLGGEHGEAITELCGVVSAVIEDHMVGLVAWEEPGFFRGPNSIFHPRLEGALILTLERLGVSYVTVPVSTLKKWATGKGNAKKPDMIRSAKYSVGDVSEHTADAVHVARWAAESAAVEAT